jgi:NitT/TauT family transport system substrate-binding protein
MRNFSRRAALGAAGFGLTAAALPGVGLAQAREIRFGIQHGLTYLPFAVIEHERLVQKHATRGGGAEPNVTYFRSAGGDVLNDGLISGNLDFVATGVSGFLTLWARGRGRVDVKGLASYGHGPVALVTRSPNVRRLADFSDRDRIALPAVRTSLQAILLQIACEKEFGPGQHGKLDAITIGRSHPDGMAAVLSNTEINSHFTVPPYLAEYAKRPDIRQITNSVEILGEPISNGVMYTSERWYRANPAAAAAVRAAMEEAVGIIKDSPQRAAEMYLAVTRERSSVETIMEILGSPGILYDTVPRSIMTFARFMARTRAIPVEPARWEDLFFPEARMPGGS